MENTSSSMSKKGRFFSIKTLIAAVMIVALFASSIYAATVWVTDENGVQLGDFPPNKPIYIHGDGFTASANIDDVCITRPDNQVECLDNSKFPVHTLTTNSQGDFSNFVYNLNGIYGNYMLKVTQGDTSATYAFSDSSVKITAPDSAATVSGTVPITFTTSESDSALYTVYYTVSSSCGTGDIGTWTKIGDVTCSKTTPCSINWNTLGLANGNNYCLGVDKLPPQAGQDRITTGVTINNPVCTHTPGANCDGDDADLCAEGIYVCNAGVETCSDANDVDTEICNNIDDDCDGTTNEGFNVGTACSNGIGMCTTTGTMVCKLDGTGTECSAAPTAPQTEVCTGNNDEDCDEQVDCQDPDCSGNAACLACTDADGDNFFVQESCTGDKDCDDSKIFVNPTATKICNGIDDDCDLLTDEGGVCCGNGLLDSLPNEQCDRGTENGQPGSCCNSDCTLKPADTICRAATGFCDVAEVCTGSAGGCPTDVFKPASTTCSDDNACTLDDVCTAGICSGTPDPFCGGCHNNAECNDDDACTQDICTAGTCSHPQITCNDNNICTDDTCNAASGCVYTDNSASCSDGLFCNGAEVCSGGQCGDAADVVCTANDITGVNACNNNPDNNLFTLDTRSAFTSTCNEATDSCTTGDAAIASTCDVSTCGAQCSVAVNCPYPVQDGNICKTAPVCENNCTCSYTTSQVCPPAGTIIDGVCYYGGTGCTETGCGRQTKPVTGCGQTCDPVNGVFDGTGPVTSNVHRTPLIPLFDSSSTESVYKTTLFATENDTCTNIKAAEYFVQLNEFPIECNNKNMRGTSLSAIGAFDSNVEDVAGTLQFNKGDDGLWWVCVRGQNTDNTWGECACIPVDVDTDVPEYPTDVVIDPKMCSGSRTITATVCDAQTPIIEGRFFIDSLLPASSHPMTIADGNGEELCEQLTASLDTEAIPDGCHEVMIHGKDIAGNWGKLYYSGQTGFVLDKTAPSTQKEITGDKIACPTNEFGTYDAGCYYVKSGTSISLTANDGALAPECRAASTSTYYNISWKESPEDDWELVVGKTLYTAPIVLDEDSMHLIEYWSEDSCGNEETHHYELDIVDNKAPTINKTVTGMQVVSNEITQYPQGPTDPVFDVKDQALYITQDTQIALSCADVQPHPVGGVKIFYKYYVDGVLKTNEYVRYTQAIEFGEDTYHELYYYCEDALGNKGPVHYELDMVDTQKPTLNKTVGEPKVSASAYRLAGYDWYVTAATPFTLSCADEGVHPVGDTTICYQKTALDAEGTAALTETCEKANSVTVYYTEDSHHRLDYSCYDALGNRINKVEFDIVDTKDPITTRTIEGPTYTRDGKTFVDGVTKIKLTCTDFPQKEK